MAVHVDSVDSRGSRHKYVARTNDKLCALHSPSIKRRRLVAVQPPPPTSQDLLRIFGARWRPSSATDVHKNDCNSKNTQFIEHGGAMSFHDPPTPVLGSMYVKVDRNVGLPAQRTDSSGDEMLDDDVVHGKQGLFRLDYHLNG